MSLISGTIGAVMGSDATESAANTQAQATRDASQIQMDMFNRQVDIMKPWTDSGASNLNRLNTAMQSGNQLDPSKRYGMADFQGSPEYQVMMQQIKDSSSATQAGAAAAGLYGSGNMATALQKNAANIALQGYGTGLQDYQAQNTLAYNQLAGLANPSAAQQVATYAGNTGVNVGNNMISGAAAQASGIIGGANALQGGLRSASGAGQSALAQYLNYNNSQNALNQYYDNLGFQNAAGNQFGYNLVGGTGAAGVSQGVDMYAGDLLA